MTIKVAYLLVAKIEDANSTGFNDVLNNYIIDNNINKEDIISVIPDTAYSGSISYFKKECNE